MRHTPVHCMPCLRPVRVRACVAQMAPPMRLHHACVPCVCAPARGADGSPSAPRSLHGYAERRYKLGIWIGFNPYKSIAIGLLILLSGVPATFVLPGPANLLWIKMSAGFEPMAVTNTDQYYDRDTSNALHNSFFVPMHGRASVVSFLPKDPVATPVFSQAFMAAVLPIVMGIYAIEADGYDFKQLCVPVGSKSFGSTLTSYTECASTANDVFSAVSWNSSLIPAAGAGVASYGAGAHDYAGPLSTLDSGLLGPKGINATGIFRSLVSLAEEPSLPYTQWQVTVTARSHQCTTQWPMPTRSRDVSLFLSLCLRHSIPRLRLCLFRFPFWLSTTARRQMGG